MSSRRTARRGSQEPRVRLEPKRKYTDGGDAAELASAYGLSPDPWQEAVLDAWLGRDAADRYTATTCGLSVPRQNGKNGILEMRELYGMCANGEKILHTAHEVKTARKAFIRLCSFFDNARQYPELAAMVVQIRRTNGQEAIVLANGGSIEFSARSRGTARGFTVDVVVFDEAQELTDEQLEAMLPTLSAAPSGNRQFIYTGTPPGPNSPGEVFGRTRKAAIEGSDKRLAWHEWSVESIGDVADRDRWYATNPAMGIRISEEFTESELTSMSEDGFARERLGWWSSASANAVIGAAEWGALATDAPPSGGKRAFGVKFSPDGANMALSVALKPRDGTPYVELIEHRSMRDGVTWIADWLIERKADTAAVVVDGRSQADTLVTLLREGGMPKKAVVVAGTGGAIASSSRFLNAVREKKISHYGQPALDESVTSATKRPIGREGGWGWGGDDSTPVESATLAYWGVMTTKRNPGRKVRLL
ncbi:hypothetical protein [Gordonibacter massiliensis (ex Traore et al. 2017)]|uniref:hypothetical protein n=1 Tax=Gordonibacter massiliensis (ex Traore et al. 2017) TaxID=1841863 RepID=UPI001C8BD38E|nr:hypothetical protein [Gordonibacter massiliensis (ex Traore et al. 2017)]